MCYQPWQSLVVVNFSKMQSQDCHLLEKLTRFVLCSLSTPFSIHRRDILLLCIHRTVIISISTIFCFKNPTPVLTLTVCHHIPTHGMWVAPTTVGIGLYTTLETRMLFTGHCLVIAGCSDATVLALSEYGTIYYTLEQHVAIVRTTPTDVCVLLCCLIIQNVNLCI